MASKINKKIVILIGIVIIILATALLSYLVFSHTVKCETQGCFDEALEECSRAHYLNDMPDASWRYEIIGRSDGRCEVKVELAHLREGTPDLVPLDGKKMSCFLPLGEVAKPEQNLRRCTGELKEEMQGIIINRLHTYISENLEEIGKEKIDEDIMDPL